MSLDDVIHKLRLLLVDQNMNKNESLINLSLISDESESLDYEMKVSFNSKTQLENWTSRYEEFFEDRSIEGKIVIIFLYCLIVLISFFGNSIVCKVVLCNSAMRSATNIYIGNLSVSDIIMTVFNIPLQLTQILSRNWPLGPFLCRCLPFFQGLSINVSSFTMACIAVDRYQVVAYPLKPKASLTSVYVKIIFIWIAATMLSFPYPALAGVQEDISYSKVTRCRLIYPEPKYQFRQLLSIITMFFQYLSPLCITGITYFKICCIIWHRRTVGVVSESQRIQRYMAKWKTIRMLIIVFLVFAICWFPLYAYHIYQDSRGVVGPNKHNSLVFLFCHCFAMSSVCYNPFLYCWLNEGFRTIAKSYFQWFLKAATLKQTSAEQRSNKLSTFSVNFHSQNMAYKDSSLQEYYTKSNERYPKKKSCILKALQTDECSLDINCENFQFLIDGKETVI